MNVFILFNIMFSDYSNRIPCILAAKTKETNAALMHMLNCYLLYRHNCITSHILGFPPCIPYQHEIKIYVVCLMVMVIVYQLDSYSYLY